VRKDAAASESATAAILSNHEMTGRLARDLARNAIELEHRGARSIVGDLVCLMCVRVATSGQQRGQVCGGTLMLDQDVSAALNQ
jgi:hypothetical protein